MPCNISRVRSRGASDFRIRKVGEEAEWGVTVSFTDEHGARKRRMKRVRGTRDEALAQLREMTSQIQDRQLQ